MADSEDPRARLAAHVRQVVSQAPPLKPEDLDSIRALLPPVAASDGRA